MLKREEKSNAPGLKKQHGNIYKAFCIFMRVAIAVMVVVLGISGYVCISASSDMVSSEEWQKSDGEDKADCIVVLGCGVVDSSPSPMLKDRLDTAIALYKKGAADKLLMSGDHGGEYYNEVGVMKLYAIEQGVPASDIFMDHAGFSTYETLYRVKELFGCNKIIAVTQEYHLYRTVYLGKSLDLDITGVSSESYKYGGHIFRILREIVARDKDFFTAVFKPEPQMPLGDKIDITGDGAVTNDKAFETLASQKGITVY